MPKHIGVIGGGLVGTSSALHLLSRGHKVTLLESSASAGSESAASYGNAGVMATYAVKPINNPTLPMRLPGLLARADGPLAFARPLDALARWAIQPESIRWLGLFLMNCRPTKVAATTAGLAALLRSAEAGWTTPFEALTAAERARAFGPATSDAARRGCLWLFSSQAEALADRAARAAHGVRSTTLSAHALNALEPAIRPIEGSSANHFEDAYHLASPGALTKALADAVARAPLGRVLTSCRAEGLAQAADGGILIDVHAAHQSQPSPPLQWRVVEGDDGPADGFGRATLSVDEVVVACGAHSARLAAAVGDSFPLGTERGYHLTWVWRGPKPTLMPISSVEGTVRVAAPVAAPPRELTLQRPVGHAALGFFLTPMLCPETGTPLIRAAGTVELGGTHAPPSAKRLDAIARAAAQLMPALGDAASGWQRLDGGEWLGFRPTMPDSLPVIGRSPKCPQVLYAFGHQHLGWTLGGITGQMVSQLVCSEVPEPNADAYAPGRSFL